MLSGVYRFPPMESVIYGRPFAEALKEQVEQSGATAVFLLASGTLARETGLVGEIRDALGNRLAGVHARIGAHTPRTDVVDAANAVSDAAELDAYHAQVGADGKIVRPQAISPTIRTIAIPTTLSAGEYTASAGCTDTARHVKESFGHQLMMPKNVILDPRVTLHTPEWLFLSTGIRAVDHAVEDICSPECQPISEGASCHALKLLGRGLLGVRADPLDLEARLECQLGAWMSMVGSQTGVPKGASHGIGHVLGGTAAVPDGYTSCVMLPHVLRFNHAINPDRQALVSAALGRPGDLAADVVAGLIAALGLPQRLRDVDVRPDQLDRIAELSMHDRWIHTNPRKIDGPPVVRGLLHAAW